MNSHAQESKLVHLLSESDNHSDVIGYFVHESKKCLIRTKRDMVLFLHSSYTVRLVASLKLVMVDIVHNMNGSRIGSSRRLFLWTIRVVLQSAISQGLR